MGAPYPTVDELLDRARASTGLEDFGGDGFREGLEQLRESLIADVPFEAEHRATATALMERRLANRLRVEAWFTANPQAADAPIDGPISICGLPRTGTTALGNMLSLDPQFRALRAWEQAEPCPPPRLADEADDPRRIAYREHLAVLLREQPEQAAMHLYDLDATMEDTEVLGLEFRAQQMTLPVWRYHAWWRAGDMRPAFAYHARVARLLQSARPPNRWLFKAPHHTFHLDHLVDAYPDARFIFTHRDPARSVPSYASFVSSLFPPYVVARLGRERIGREIHGHLLDGMHRALAARDRLGPDRFLDIHHADLTADPMGVLERIYAWLGLDLTGPVRDRLAAWQRGNGAGAHGGHRYSAEDFGLRADAIRDEYAAYIRRFDVACRRR